MAEPSSSFDFSRLAYRKKASGANESSGSTHIQTNLMVVRPQRSPSKKRKDAGASAEDKPSPSKKRMEALQAVRLLDFLRPNLDILIIGFNPGCNSASHGHHYAGPGNHFWKCLYQSGLVLEPLTFRDDIRLMDFGIGLTNIVGRPSSSSADLSRFEMAFGAIELRKKIMEFQPRIAVFNGLGIYETFSGSKNFALGKQPGVLRGGEGNETIVYVMPSSSPRGTKWPRVEDKLKFYTGLLHLREYLQGKVQALDLDRVTFPK